ncbi:DUF4214 domain-containing protein [Teichococcus vastitatis]|uniref:DUF4214 domain-containing protein n=1 Tax=Teichococcus vastitatis TaxID=2307076 RepID=UPI00130060EB
MGREPQATWLQAYTGALNAGMSREQLLVNFSESAENRLQTAAENRTARWPTWRQSSAARSAISGRPASG